MNKMNKVALEVAKHPVGLDEAVQDFNTVALQSAGSAQIVGIWGMGGSGKTTLAKEIFNKRCSAMDRSSFLFDLRDAAEKGLLVDKQKKLLEDLGVKGVSFDHVDVGKEILKSRLKSVSVLIILDDVDHTDQLDALLPLKESLGGQSLIIVTTRDANVLQQWGISLIYHMRPLKAFHSKQLFCWHAFLQKIPPSEFDDLVDKFLNACQGLPLSLKVLGGQLYGRSDKEYWKRTFNQFSQIPHGDVTKRLKVSYDALEKREKEMFLDAACLFIGHRKSVAIVAWDAEWDGLLGWDALFNKCLVEVDQNGLIRMHDHLRDLGREIANGQSPYRLWSPHQIIEIPLQLESIRVRGIANAVGDNCYQQQGKIIINTSQGERSLAPCTLGLKIFVGNGDFINQRHNEISRELVWLHCYEFEHKNVPLWLSLKNLRILELIKARSLEDLWEQDGNVPLQSREFDPKQFCRFKLLEHLEIIQCTNLSSLPNNFGELIHLQHLNLKGCTKLKMLPDVLENMTKLRYLNLDGCNKVEELHLPEVASLTELHLNETSLKLLPGNIFKQTRLTELKIGSEFLTTLPTSLGNLSSLTTFKIQGCEKLESLPNSLEHLNFLRDLNIEQSGVKCLPKSLIHLERLRIINTPISELIFGLGCMLKSILLGGTKVSKISICGDCCPFLETLRLFCNKELRGLENLPPSLKSIEVYGCDLLKDIRGVRNLKNLQNLEIECCEELDELSIGGDCCPFLETLILKYNKDLRVLETLPATLKTIEVYGCDILKDIRGVHGLKNLQKLEIECCEELKELPCFAELVSLETFVLKGCSKVKKVELDLVNITSLKNFQLGGCHVLEKMEGLENMKSLETLKIEDCSELDKLPSLAELTCLREFELQTCHKLEKIKGLENMRSLEMLRIDDCPELDELPSLAQLISLKNFQLGECHKLEKIEGLENLISLEMLRLNECPDLDELPSLAELTCHIELELQMCHKLEKIDGLENMRSLETLYIRYCPKLEALPSLVEITSLKNIQLGGCHKLEKIEGIENLRSLEMLRIDDCPVLAELPSLLEITSLKKFQLGGCHKLEKIEGLENLRSLKTLRIDDCPELDELPSLAELTLLTEFKLGMCHKLEKIGGLENLKSLERLRIYDCPELDELPSLAELTSLKEFDLRMTHKLEKIEGLENLRSLETLSICDCPELNELPSLGELISITEFKLLGCPQLQKIDGLERLRLLEKLELHTCWNTPCIVSLEHSERLESLVVIANRRSAIEPFVSYIQKWPSEVMICTRSVFDVGSLEIFFEGLPDVCFVDYTQVDKKAQGYYELRRPVSSRNANAIMICFIIVCVYTDLQFEINEKNVVTESGFKIQVGRGKWIWMGVFTQNSSWLWSRKDIFLASRKVKFEACLVVGEEGSLVKAFHQLLQRN
ncbi:disease resistance protein L6 isoform X2 [Cryptomeria japonica]|nr:disease resistance protein L6 isoform X2 [Cryptomeria japonica]